MRITASVVALLTLLGSAPAQSQQLGNVQAGLAYARAHCGECHGVEKAKADFSPNIDAPDFSEVANTPGMTERALIVWLQTPHPTMPNFMIPENVRDDLVAYIMSLKVAKK
ncbi:cytochrome c [Hyphomicrobium sp.]|uniref:c-type cytochrome n=1 Tax=Hyphomicrobium sp. TaxID=82 RepID=UPI002E314A38|nr:cytochrome c [Hyphomicrobium sp.]HEX2842535.1 cytochrome c [Hyphomicrobium sp.]